MKANFPITNLFDQQLPDRDLFHYTSTDGLIGMVGKRSIWATNIEHLNDVAEFQHGKEVLRKVVASRKKNVRGLRREFFEALDHHSDIFQAEDVFVMSLSEERDLLSQWRGYTPSNCGFSIGFDAPMLAKTVSDLDDMHLVRCLYDANEQEELAKAVLDDCLDQWIEYHQEKRQRRKEEGIIRRTISPSLTFSIYSTFIAASMKHHTFAEEKEWRLLGICKQRERFRFRAGKSSLTPYIELMWGKGTKTPEAQPITSVTVGPCPDPQLGSKSVSRLLKSYGLENVWVSKSQIPFRSW